MRINLIGVARYWRQMGIATIPIQWREKTPDNKLLPKDSTGHANWEVFKHRLPTDTEYSRWFSSPLQNIGLVVGWQNLVVIDFDSVGAYTKWATWIARRVRVRFFAKNTLMVKTARGVHVYARTKNPEQNRKLPEIDIKAKGGYVLIPPSVHPSGVEYTVMQQGVPVQIDSLSDILPAELLLQHTEYAGGVIVPGQIIPMAGNNDPWATAEMVYNPSWDLIQQIRQRNRIEDFFPGVTRSGNRWMMALCPFHDDKKPSFWIDVQRQICGCHACQFKPLDVINLYARLHGLSNNEAIWYMAHRR